MGSQERVGNLRGAVADALIASRDASAGLGSSDSSLFEIALVSLAEGIHAHASAILHLVKGGHRRSSIVLLRTLIEVWIMARYIAADTTGARAAAYIMKGPKGASRYLNALLRLVTEKPSEERAAVTSAGLASLDDLKERIAQLSEELDKAERNGVPQFPSVIDCAKATGLEVTYRSVYGFLFSEVVHAGVGDTLRGWLGGSDIGDARQVLVTTFFLQVELLALTNEHFGTPDRVILDSFKAQLTELADDSTRSMFAESDRP